MTKEDRALLDRINKYADKVLDRTQPQNTRTGFQFEKLRPVMQEIAMEQSMPVEDVLIKYLDLVSEASIELEQKFHDTVNTMNTHGDLGDIKVYN